MSRYGMHLNNKGQCFNCLIKPLVYKRPTLHYFCHRCDREFDGHGNFQSNWAWEDEYLPTERLAHKNNPKLFAQRQAELERRKNEALL